MQPIRHLMWFDIRSLRPPLIVWGLVLLIQAAILALGPGRLGGSASGSPVAYDLGALIIRLATTVFVAALLVQRDPLVGTTAFWRTRPIPRHTLLVSKLSTTILLLVVLPWLVLFAVQAGLGLGLADAAYGATEVAVEQAVVLAMALMAAVVTASLAHFVIAGIAGVTFVTLLNGILLPALVTTWPALGDTYGGWQPAVYSALVVAGAIGVVACQYLTLRAWQSVAAVAFVLILASAATRFWPWQMAEPSAPRVSSEVVTPGDVTASVEGASIREERYTRLTPGGTGSGRRYSATLDVSGEPAAIILRPFIVDATLTFGDGSKATFSEMSRSHLENAQQVATASDQPYRSVQTALGDVDLILPTMSTPTRSRLYFFEATEDVVRRQRTSPGAFTASLEMEAFKYVVKASTPAQPGRQLKVANRAIAIAALSVLPDGVSLVVRGVELWSVSRSGRDAGPGYYVLRNASRRQAVFVTPRGTLMFRGTLGISSTSLYVTATTLETRLPQPEASRIRLDYGWLEGAELLLVEPELIGTVTIPLQIPKFVPGSSGE